MLKEYLDFAKDIARKAGEITLRYFNENNGARYKSDRTVVTKADTEINDYLISRVKEVFPDHAVDGEEGGFGNSRFVWVCDPVDGTAMYARRIPVSVFSLALVEDGEPIVGVIYDPFGDEMFTAVKGGGAFMNGEEIHVSDEELDGMKTVVDLDRWPGTEYDVSKIYDIISQKTYTMHIGSITHAAAYVACGKFPLTLFPGTVHKNCDIAAAKVIVEEAGGKVTDFFGNEQRYDKGLRGAVVSNGKVHDEVLKIIKENLK